MTSDLLRTAITRRDKANKRLMEFMRGLKEARKDSTEAQKSLDQILQDIAAGQGNLFEGQSELHDVKSEFGSQKAEEPLATEITKKPEAASLPNLDTYLVNLGVGNFVVPEEIDTEVEAYRGDIDEFEYARATAAFLLCPQQAVDPDDGDLSGTFSTITLARRLTIREELENIGKQLNLPSCAEDQDDQLSPMLETETGRSAIQIARSEGKCSSTMLQRRLQLTYPQADALIHAMISDGILSSEQLRRSKAHALVKDEKGTRK